MTEPGSGCAGAGGVCIPCTTGQLEVRVFLQTLCWDTDPALGEDTPDRPFTGVRVSISGGTAKPPKKTDGSGLVRFDGLSPGSYTISAEKPGFRDNTAEVLSECPLTPGADVDALMLVGRQEVEIHETTKAVRVMRRQFVAQATPEAPKGRECSRKHAKLPGGGSAGRSIPLPVFWVFWDEPWVMILRDLLWLACLITIPIAAVKGNVALAAWAAAFFAYLSTVTFGQVPGIILMVAAFATFGVAMVMATMQRMFGGHPSAAWVAYMSATWAGFTWGLARGRRPNYYNTEKLEIIVGGVLGLVVAIVLYFLFGGSFDTPSGVLDGIGEVLLAIVMLAVAFGSGALGALFPHTFTNENKLDPGARWMEGYKLPYAGEHYCVQGHRGFISHTNLGNHDQENSYDWEFPLGKPILAAREGHIVLTQEKKDGFQGIKILGLQIWGDGNTTANEVKVRHRDESVANYLHLRQYGVSEINPAVPAAVDADKLHVYEGQQIAAAGSVGISMFSHLHFMVDRPPAECRPDDDRGPIKLTDGDTARHEKRCYSMRKYVSSNVDRGPVKVTADHPPFKPGGPATTGEPYPVPAGSAGGGGGGLFGNLPGGLPGGVPGGLPGGMPGGLPEGLPPIPGGAPPTAIA